MFILRQRLFLAAIALATLGWAAMLLVMTHNNGKLDAGNAVMLGVIALLCGGGTAALTVLPGFMIYRGLFTKTPEPALVPGEQVLHTARANHFLNGEGRGGHLYLTDRQLVFCPHRFNVQLAPWSAPWEQVAGASIRNSALVTAAAIALDVPSRPLQNFLDIQLTDGTTVRLVAQEREELARLIERLRRLPAAERPAAAAA